MSSDFAEFLFSFACSKLESSPQLDLRQQLLHSNLIRHILLVHPPAPTSTTTNAADPRQDDDARRVRPPSPPPQLHSPAPQSLSFGSSTSPPSKPAAATTQSNTYGLDLSSPFQQFQPSPQPLAGVALSNWSPFCFDDELDRIRHPQAIMSQNSPPTGATGAGAGPDHVALQDDQDVVMMEDEDPAALNLFPPYVYFRDSYHPTISSASYDYGYGLDEDDDDYRFASTQAQEDWLDAVLEDLIEEDQQDDDSSHEYDSEDDLYCTETEDMSLPRGKTVKPDKDELSEPRSSAWSTQRGLFPDSMILDPTADAMWP
ncbi:hypothetical protein BGZ75_006157 [Mortierella antarctica]|nr:hypothetical protein BGZ75_006157 [Mortierella antarctica]